MQMSAKTSQQYVTTAHVLQLKSWALLPKIEPLNNEKRQSETKSQLMNHEKKDIEAVDQPEEKEKKDTQSRGRSRQNSK